MIVHRRSFIVTKSIRLTYFGLQYTLLGVSPSQFPEAALTARTSM
jgi:hypothetical protein